VLLYRLLVERSGEKDINISHTECPTPAEHMAFFMGKPYPVWELIECDGQFIGYVSATPRNEIGVVLLRAWRGHGFGREAVSLFMQRHQPPSASPSERSGRWLANINPRNERSIRMFEKLGFKVKQVTYEAP